ncbi:MAG: polysaccharide deacetylase family protein [Phycisphaerae bacterium]|nr:polysaccharide deacetylase family protein [Phycisphaerae bacterium]
MVYRRHGLGVRIVYLLIACVAHVFSGLGRRFAGRWLVLCYHGVCDTHASRFREQMRHLSRSASRDAGGNEHCVSRRSLPDVHITFDDAFENLMRNALPALHEFGIPAVVFAVSGNLGKTPQWRISPDHPEYGERLMTAGQLREIANGCVVIGSHTQTHPSLTELSREQVRTELAESRKCLEETLGRPVVDLALPHGAYNDAVLEVAREVGYKRIYTLQPRVHGAQENGDVVGRFSMSPDVWPIEFRLTCAGAYAWLGPWRRCARAIRRWAFGNR